MAAATVVVAANSRRISILSMLGSHSFDVLQEWLRGRASAQVSPQHLSKALCSSRYVGTYATTTVGLQSHVGSGSKVRRPPATPGGQNDPDFSHSHDWTRLADSVTEVRDLHSACPFGRTTPNPPPDRHSFLIDAADVVASAPALPARSLRKRQRRWASNGGSRSASSGSRQHSREHRSPSVRDRYAAYSACRGARRRARRPGLVAILPGRRRSGAPRPALADSLRLQAAPCPVSRGQ